MSATKEDKGRPADAELTARILAATRELVIRDGYSGLKIERVVREVGCGKSAVYRRYSNKVELFVAAVLDVISLGETPDTGSVREDLLVHVQQNQTLQADAQLRQAWSGLFDPEVFAGLWESFFSFRRDAGVLIIERAVARGELPANVEPDIILDTVAGFTLYHQTVKGHRATPADYRSILDALISKPPLLSATEK